MDGHNEVYQQLVSRESSMMLYRSFFHIDVKKQRNRKPQLSPATFSAFSLYSAVIVFYSKTYTLPKGGAHIFEKVDVI